MASPRRAMMALLAVCVTLATVVSAASSSTRDCSAMASTSDTILYFLLTGRSSIGGCYIQDWGGGSCSLYAKSSVKGVRGDKGHPKNKNNDGTGCVGDSGFCYYRRAKYVLSAADRSDFCTADRKHNAVAQIRHAMRTGACGRCEVCTRGVSC